jgi:ribonuclease-3
LSMNVPAVDTGKLSDVLSRFHPGLDAKDLRLYEHALNVGSTENERLEFLGDAVIGLIAASHVFAKHPDVDEGGLSRARTDIVRGTTLAVLCKTSGVVGLLPPTVSHNLSSKVLEDAMESFVGAMYLDTGLTCCEKWFGGVLDCQKETIDSSQSVLMKWCRNRNKRVSADVSRSGRKGFVCVVTIDGVLAGRGESTERKDAERKAYDDAWAYANMITL